MASKNIFELLPDSETEEQENQQENQSKANDKKKAKQSAASKPAAQKGNESTTTKRTEKKDEKPSDRGNFYKKQPAKGEQAPFSEDNGSRGDPKHLKFPKEGPKSKGVPAEPHPLDRRSGTGIGKESKKGGAGSRNWGSEKDEVKNVLEDKYEVKEKEPENKESELPEVKEEPKPDEPQYMTIEDYYSMKNIKKVVQDKVDAPKKAFEPGQKN